MRAACLVGPAVAALMLAQGATAKAPTRPPREPIYFTITLQNAAPIKAEALKWGDAQSASLGSWSKVDGLDVNWDVPSATQYSPGNSKYPEVKLTRAAPAGSAPVGGVTVASGDVNDSDSPGRVTGVVSDPPDPNARGGHSMLGASDKVTVSGSQTESGQATGKRQHMPIRARAYYDAPQGDGPGSLVVKGSVPGCTVGKRYGGAQFASGGKSYELRDVTIANCSPGAAALIYSKATVRGWDPKKKEE